MNVCLSLEFSQRLWGSEDFRLLVVPECIQWRWMTRLSEFHLLYERCRSSRKCLLVLSTQCSEGQDGIICVAVVTTANREARINHGWESMKGGSGIALKVDVQRTWTCGMRHRIAHISIHPGHLWSPEKNGLIWGKGSYGETLYHGEVFRFCQASIATPWINTDMLWWHCLVCGRTKIHVSASRRQDKEAYQ